MNKIEICKNCGEPYDANDVEDGYCLLCTPEDSRAILDAPVIAMRNVSELDAD